MVDATRIFPPGFQVTNAAGVVQSSAVLRFYDTSVGGTTRTVYSNPALSTSLGVTVTTNASGRPAASGGAGAEVIVYTGTTPYGVKAETSAGVTLWSFDGVIGALDTSAFLTGSVIAEETVETKTTDYTVLDADQGTVFNGNSTGGTFTFTLPNATTVGDGWLVTIRHTGTANSVIIAGVSSQTINGQTTRTLTKRYETVKLVSDAANWHVIARVEPEVFDGTVFVRTNLPVVFPQGRLSLTSGTPVLAADVVAATSVYYMPFNGNVVPVYDGTNVTHRAISELTLALHSSHAIATIYDVFYFNDGPGTDRIGTGPAWTTITAGAGARGSGAGTTELTRSVGGYLTNTVSMTVRNGASTYTVAANRGTYLGSIYIDGTAGQITCHVAWGQSRKWGVWNAYNRVPIILRVGDATSSWAYTTATIRASNSLATNSATVFSGLAEEWCDILFNQNGATASNAGAGVTNAIGWNSTTALSGKSGSFISTNQVFGGTASITASYQRVPSLGINTITALETGTGTASSTFNGGEDDMVLSARWRG